MNPGEIKKDLTFLKEYDVVLYGSYVTGDFRQDSDIDVAVITKIRDDDKNLELLKSFIGKAKPIYDIRIFELLPLKIKASVMSNYDALYGNEPDISEYFYYFRKQWDDQKRRIISGYFESYKDKIAAMNKDTG